MTIPEEPAVIPADYVHRIPYFLYESDKPDYVDEEEFYQTKRRLSWGDLDFSTVREIYRNYRGDATNIAFVYSDDVTSTPWSFELISKMWAVARRAKQKNLLPFN